MAGPIAAIVQLPDDAGNVGKKMRTQSRVVGSNTVHEHFFIEARLREILGVYRAALAQQTVAAAAQNGTSTGFLWAHVPTAVTNKWVRLRRMYVTSQHSTVLATPTAPRLAVSRMTFTGTASGAAVVAAKNDSAAPTPVFDLRTVVTGLTPSLVALLGAIGLTGALTAVGAYAPALIDCVDTDGEDQWTIFKPGEGLVLWQDTAGTAADTRKFNPVLVWDEVDLS